MEADAEIVQIPTQLQLVLPALEPMRSADLEVLLDADEVARVRLQRLSHPLPGPRERDADMGKALEAKPDRCDQIVQAAVRRQVDRIRLLREIPEAGPQGIDVEIPSPVLLFVLHQENRAGRAQELRDVEPVVEIRVLLALVRHEKIQGAAREEELVCGVIDLLAAEVPDVDAKRSLDQRLTAARGHPDGTGELPATHLDALGRRPRRLEDILPIADLVRQRRLSRSRLPDDEQLCLAEIVDHDLPLLAPVVLD